MKMRLCRFRDRKGVNWEEQEDAHCTTQGKWAYCGVVLWDREEELSPDDIDSELIDCLYVPELHKLEWLAEIDLGPEFDGLDRLFDEGEECIVSILDCVETQLLLLQSKLKRDNQPLRATQYGFIPLTCVWEEEMEEEEEEEF